MRRIAIVFMVIALLFLSGSQHKTSKETLKADSSVPSAAGGKASDIKLIKKTAKASYLLRNGVKENLKRETISTGKGEVQLELCQISGLKDKSVEDIINSSIEAAAVKEVKNYIMEMFDVPFYGLSTHALLDSNNILSVSIEVNKAEESIPIYGMLFRLTDGKRLYLKDIFTEGTDYVPLVNEKITENLIGGETAEEDVLREPFTSIKTDQDFALAQSELYVIFRRGQSGFRDRTAVKLSLSAMDDCIDVLDKYSAAPEKAYEFPDLMVESNNIFLENKTTSVKKTNGNIFIQYAEISGTRDSELEKLINSTIQNDVFAALKSNIPEDVPALEYGSASMPIGSIFTNVAFNHYGILTIERRINFSGSEAMDNLLKVYSFDLRSKKPIDTKQILKDYLEKNPEAQEVFVKVVKDKFAQSLSERNITLPRDFGSVFNFSFIMEHSTIYFTKYLDNANTNMNVIFNRGAFKDVPVAIECYINYKDAINADPENLFS